MADKDSDTGMLLFGLAILLGVSVLFWKLSTSTNKTIVTSFTRDPKTNAIISVTEKEIK